MLTSIVNKIRNEESGFTMVEILVVVVILGILAAIAIPVFFNQRQKANDVTVVSDVANLAMFMDTSLIEDHAAPYFTNHSASGDITDEGFLTDVIYISVGDAKEMLFYTTEGVYIDVYGSDGRYSIEAYHINGDKYTVDNPLTISR